MSNHSEFNTRIRDILKPFVKEGMTLSDDSELVDELGLTSLQVMELIEAIEDRFDVSFPLNNLPNLRTVRHLVQQLEQIVES